MKHFFSALLMVLFATSMMAQQGLKCDDPIFVNKDYKGSVDGPGVLWYSAYTYDLPLHVYFSPNSLDSDVSPEVTIDLTCTPGHYEDPKVDSLLKMVTDFGIDFPVVTWCDKVVRNGKVEWDLEINQSYRDQLAEFGITYNVQAFVKVEYFEGGTISLTPDTVFSSCIEHSDSIALGDSIDILADDVERAFIVSYADWQNDSIRFVWTGEQPVQVYLATTKCDFAIDGGYVWDSFEVTAETPYKLYSSQMKEAIKEQQGGGIFYGKIVSPTAGKLVIEKIPMNKPKGDAILMQYDQPIEIGANDNTLYCFPRTWTATQFVAATSSATSVYFSNQPDFGVSATDANVLATYEFDAEDGQRVLYLSNVEVSALTDNVLDDYVYVRFQSSSATTITPSAWVASRCVVNSVLIHPNNTFTIENNSNTVYRFKYADFEGYGFVLKWANTLTTLPTYIADTCTFGLTTGDKHVIRYGNIREGKQMTIKPDVYAGWASRADADGYLYVRFNPDYAGNVTFVTDKPAATPDPIYITLADTLCFGDTCKWNDSVYVASGTYEQKFVATTGADSIVTLNLTILPEVLPTTEEATIRYDELPYLWNDSAFTESTVYTVTLQDKHGCDSVATLKLTVLEKSDIKTTDDVALALQSAFKVYTMDHADWVAQSVVLHWQGASPLHIFVAKEEVHNLTPYNRHVLHYEMIPAGEEWILTKEQMAAWEAEATAAGGKLYVRFLTEHEGKLTTVPVK